MVSYFFTRVPRDVFWRCNFHQPIHIAIKLEIKDPKSLVLGCILWSKRFCMWDDNILVSWNSSISFTDCVGNVQKKNGRWQTLLRLFIHKGNNVLCTFVFNRASILVLIILFCREVLNITELKLVTDLRHLHKTNWGFLINLWGDKPISMHREGISRVRRILLLTLSYCHSQQSELQPWTDIEKRIEFPF